MDTPDLSALGLPEKEEKILQAAIKVFSEKGFSAATTSEIAKNAGVAEGTIFRYFKTKKDILRGILVHTISLLSQKYVLSGIEKILQEGKDKDVREVLKAIIYDRMKLVDSIFPMARVILAEALFHEDVREAVFENIITNALKMFKDFIDIMSEKGITKRNLDVIPVFRAILGNMFMLIAQKKTFGDKLPIEDLDKEIDTVIDILLYGIANKDEKSSS